MLWVDRTHKFATGNDVCACTPAIWDIEAEEWVVPTEYATSEAYKVQNNHVPKKQHHYCTPVDEPGCRAKGPCK
jgi:hypothetical protein